VNNIFNQFQKTPVTEALYGANISWRQRERYLCDPRFFYHFSECPPPYLSVGTLPNRNFAAKLIKLREKSYFLYLALIK